MNEYNRENVKLFTSDIWNGIRSRETDGKCGGNDHRGRIFD